MTATTTRKTSPVKKATASKGSSVDTGQAALDIEFMEVTPAMADEWLDTNIKNRNLRRRKVNEFTRDMINRNWRNIGDPIRFDTDGRLVDGQHRLTALLEAAEEDPDIVIPLLVVRGVAPEDQVVMDTGTRRTAADQLKMQGYTNYAVLANAAKWLIFWERNALDADTVSIKNVTHTEIMAYVQRNPEIQNLVGEVVRLKTYYDLPIGYVAAAWMICQRINAEDADDFFHRLADGVNLAGGDPILALRNRLRELRTTRTHLQGEVWLSLLIRAWNARREGVTLRKLPLHRAGTIIPCPPAI